ncbi:MAG TPA: hypothetical protein VN923_04790 [Thermoanaerobaculia bacterium]|nr:hypothetical protein [Thermoanaerobaculia bacterium]
MSRRSPGSLVIAGLVSTGLAIAAPSSAGASADLSIQKDARAIANLSAGKFGAPDPVMPGTDLTYTINVHNAGPSDAADVELNDPLPDGTTFVSLTAPAGWSCSTPAVGAGGAVQCTLPSLPPGDAAFTLVVKVDPDVVAGTRLHNRGSFLSTTPYDSGHGGMFSALTTVGNGAADISLAMSDAPDPVAAGDDIVYTITASNAGPSNAPTATLTDSVPAGTTFASLSSPPGWSCVTPPVGGGGDVSCSHGYLPPGDHVFTLVVKVDAGTAAGTVIANSAGLTMLDFTDPNPGDCLATADTTVGSGGGLGANVTGSNSVAGTFQTGSIVTYTVVLHNSGRGPQHDNAGDEFTDVLPAGLTLLDATGSAGAAVASGGTNTVTWNGSIAAGGLATITISATIDAPSGAIVANEATVAFDADGNGSNETAQSTDDPLTTTPGDATRFLVRGQAIVNIPALDWRGLLALVALLAAAGVAWLRRG